MLGFRDSLPMILYRTLDAVMPLYRELFSRFDLTEQQWRVLRVLWADQSATVKSLSEQTLLPAPSLVGILDRMEKKELVARIRSVEDRRNVLIVATAQGRALQTEIMPLIEQVHQTVQATVSTEEFTAMHDTMTRITQATQNLRLADALGETPKLESGGKR